MLKINFNSGEIKILYNKNLYYYKDKLFTGILISEDNEWHCYNGMHHRLDGPTVIFKDGESSWYYNDNKISCSSQEDFEKIISIMQRKEKIKIFE